MRSYDVSCYRKDNGRFCWGMTQEAENPIEAIAQACLSTQDAGPWIRRMHNEGWDELPDLITDHPISEGFEVRAEMIP